MFSEKDNDDSLVRKHTHHTEGGGRGGGAGGERSELLDSHGRQQTHQTTREEEDLPDLSNTTISGEEYCKGIFREYIRLI